MPVYLLDDTLWFPPVDLALEDGLLAVGGDLTPGRLLLAYRSGIFPWFNDDELPMWWCPDPRFVLFPEQLKVSKSMKQLLGKGAFEFKTNTDFEQLITRCQQATRIGQDGTWITNEIVTAYTSLHRLGYAHCAEVWQAGKLVGGLYGIRLGNIFFGESMFSDVSNASKYAFIRYVQQLRNEGVVIVDCQVYTEHLESLGARMVPRSQFLNILSESFDL